MYKVSVYIPTRNRRFLLERAIDSVRSQTYEDVEIVVGDDCSDDGTLEYLQEMNRAGVLSFVSNPRPMGACAARNAAIQIASGEFMTGLDDDDCFLPDRIERFVNAWNLLKRGIYDDWQRKTNEGNKYEQLKDGCNFEQLLTRNHVGNQLFCPAVWYKDVGMFDVDLPAWQDWDLWLRISKRFGEFVNIHVGTYIYDERDANNRISVRPEAVLRKACSVFIDKNRPITKRQKVAIIEKCLLYPQVKMRAMDVLDFVLAGEFRKLYGLICWKKNESRV